MVAATTRNVRRAEPMSWSQIWPQLRKALLTYLVMQLLTGNLYGLDTVKKWLGGAKVELKTDLTASDPEIEPVPKTPSLRDVARKYAGQDKKEEEPKVPPYHPLWWPVSYVEADLHVSVDGALDEPSVDFRVRLDQAFDEVKPLTVTIPANFNGTLTGNIKVTRRDGGEFYETSFNLTSHKKRKTQKRLIHLLENGENDKFDDSIYQDIILPYYSPNISLGMVYDKSELPLAQMPWPIVKHYVVDHNRTGYFPVIFHNTFWTLESQLKEINATEPVEVTFNIELYKLRFLYFQALAGLVESANTQHAGQSELDSFKKVLLDTNPWLLTVTVAVSGLHMLFEFLAFKNDISHWRKKKDTVGVSVRSIAANVIMQLIILLYLMDNSEETNHMILLSQGFSILVEAWKILKVWNRPDEEKTEVEKQTEEYDGIAFRYMYMVAVPLVLAYAGYSLKYETHKSWYSFIIATLVGSVYAYGFLMLVPSIYINYRLKSVAHIPRRAMIYKFLNTFIDDLFAFVIKMPWLHRIATLRDDVIFLVYLYQTYLYRVDYRRVNEFGQGGEDESDKAEKKE